MDDTYLELRSVRAATPPDSVLDSGSGQRFARRDLMLGCFRFHPSKDCFFLSTKWFAQTSEFQTTTRPMDRIIHLTELLS